MLFPTVLALNLEFNQIKQAAQGVASRLMTYYIPNDQGAVPPNTANDASGIQWFESGILWGAMMDYAKVSGDAQFVTTVTTALVSAAYGPAANFLGPAGLQDISATLQGRWNDDIMWWAMGPAVGGQLYGNKDLIEGVNYNMIANNTLTSVWQQWDNACGGGIYWSRDRQSSLENQRTYKSSITNAQYLYMTAMLYGTTKDASYMTKFDQVYQWMKTSGIIDKDWKVADGVRGDCSVEHIYYSYSVGATIAGLAEAYRLTQKKTYLDDAIQLFIQNRATYSVQNVITDPCELTKDCKQNQWQYKGMFVRGLMLLYPIAPAETQKDIKTLIDGSVLAMSESCDAQWNCDNKWLARGKTYNFHTQINALELMNAVTLIYNPKPLILSQPTNNALGLAPWFLFSLLLAE